MTSAREMTAEEIIETDPVTANISQSLGSVKNTMEKKELRALPVVDDENRLEGVIGYRDLIRFIQFSPKKTKLSKVMHQPPEFDMDDNLIDLCDLRINSGRKMMVRLGGKKLKGVIGDREFVKAFSQTDELEKISTKDIETTDVLTVYEDDTIEQTRHMMLDKNVSRLPVVDKNGNLTGIIKSTDILKTMIARHAPDAGGTAGERDSGEVNIAGGNEKESLSDVTVDQIMDRLVNIAEESMSAKEAAQKMVDENDGVKHEIVFVDGNYPESIVTLKDMMDHLADLAPGKTVFVNITGLDVDEEVAMVQRKIRKQIQGSLGRKLDRPKEIRVVVDKSEKDGKKHRWEIDLRLDSEFGLTSINEEGWELMDVVDESLNKLNEVIRRKHEKRTEHR